MPFSTPLFFERGGGRNDCLEELVPLLFSGRFLLFELPNTGASNLQPVDQIWPTLPLDLTHGVSAKFGGRGFDCRYSLHVSIGTSARADPLWPRVGHSGSQLEKFAYANLTKVKFPVGQSGGVGIIRQRCLGLGQWKREFEVLIYEIYPFSLVLHPSKNSSYALRSEHCPHLRKGAMTIPQGCLQ